MAERGEGMAKPKALYDEDFFRWTEEQAAALRQAKGSSAAEPRAGWWSIVREARSEIESVLDDSPSLRREAEAMIKKQIRTAAELATDDLRNHGEPIDAIRARLEGEEYTEQQVLEDWFPDEPG